MTAIQFASITRYVAKNMVIEDCDKKKKKKVVPSRFVQYLTRTRSGICR